MKPLVRITWSICAAMSLSAAGDALVGFGGLTATLDERGVVTHLAWPEPGGPNQIRAGAENEGHPYGIHWRVHRESRWLEATDPEWTVERTSTLDTDIYRYTRPGWDGFVTLRAAVSPRRDLLALRWEATASLEVDRVEWRLDLAPRTRQVPEWSAAHEDVPALSDFASFHDLSSNLGVHFRPDRPGRETWQRADGLQRTSAGWQAWSAFDPGIWMGYTTEPPPTGIGYTRPDGIRARRETSLTGPASAFIETIPGQRGETLFAELFVILAPASDGVDELRDTMRREFLRDSIEDARSIWRQTFEPVSAIDSEPIATAMRTILASRGRHTGVVVDTAPERGGDALVRPENLAFVPPALARNSYPDLAKQQLAAWCAMAASRPVPGALPTAMYADDVLAVPRWEVAYAPAAWALWSISETLAELPIGDANLFVSEQGSGMESMSRFVARWVEPDTGLPLTPHEAGESEAAYTLRRAALGRLALWSALRVTELTSGTPELELEALLDEMDFRIRSYLERNRTEVTPQTLLNLVVTEYPIPAALLDAATGSPESIEQLQLKYWQEFRGGPVEASVLGDALHLRTGAAWAGFLLWASRL